MFVQRLKTSMPRYPLQLNSFPVPTVCPRLETDGGATACLYTYLHALALVGTSGTGTDLRTGHRHRPQNRPRAPSLVPKTGADPRTGHGTNTSALSWHFGAKLELEPAEC